MAFAQTLLSVSTAGQGFYDLTDSVSRFVQRSGTRSGLAHVFCRHTSCSLVIMENADPSARHDLLAWLNRLVKPRDPLFTHTAEGPDDMPSHIKMALLRTSETIPIWEGRLALGTWQGLFLWEHRDQPHRRECLLTVQGSGGLPPVEQ